jgi:tetratricopeptide (TPR) repeat protein
MVKDLKIHKSGVVPTEDPHQSSVKVLMNNSRHDIIGTLMEESFNSIDQGCHEDAVHKLQTCLQLEDRVKNRATIFNKLGQCFLDLRLHEEALKAYAQFLEVYPSDNDGRFFLAHAYACLGWYDEAIVELKSILASDPSDFLARHGLALCYRDTGRLEEALREIRRANVYATNYGTPDEREIVKSSFAHIEHEIKNGIEYDPEDPYFHSRYWQQSRKDPS